MCQALVSILEPNQNLTTTGGNCPSSLKKGISKSRGGTFTDIHYTYRVHVYAAVVLGRKIKNMKYHIRILWHPKMVSLSSLFTNISLFIKKVFIT